MADCQVGYPTLTAFLEFIADFELPVDASLKKGEMAVPETGRPFRPAMFDRVLKKFTPDVPNSISGRPRCVFMLFPLVFVTHSPALLLSFIKQFTVVVSP